MTTSRPVRSGVAELRDEGRHLGGRHPARLQAALDFPAPAQLRGQRRVALRDGGGHDFLDHGHGQAQGAGNLIDGLSAGVKVTPVPSNAVSRLLAMATRWV